MKLQWIFMLLVIFSFVYPTHQHTLVQEKVELEFVDKNLVDITASLRIFNSTIKMLKATFLVKVDVPENFMIYTKGFKNINNNYNMKLFQYDVTLQKSLEMEFFDLQALYLQCIRPALVWPLEKNIVYRLEGWNPDYAKWMPNFPAGRWKFQLNYAFPNKTSVVVLNWFVKIQ